jgi:uncharacterized membrane protein required for colicin V production
VTWFDIVAILVLIVIAWLESLRGFGRSLFDLLGAVVTLKLAPILSDWLATSYPVIAKGGPSQSFWLGMVVLVMGAAIIVITRLIYQSTLLSLDYLDPVAGGLLGLATGLIVVFFFLRVLQLDWTGTAQAKVLMDSFVGQELLDLRSYRHVVEALQNLGK